MRNSARRRISPIASRRLRILVHLQLDEADEALQRFYGRYRDNYLVLDKWFAVQATVPAHEALERVERLTGDPAFSLKNPNRVYSLIRTFAAANPVGFNRPDGAGYRFIAEIIGKLDAQNPSVAARDRHRLPLLPHAGAGAARPGGGGAPARFAIPESCRATSPTSSGAPWTGRLPQLATA